MRLVIDTNVLVAALLHPGRTPDRALEAVFAGRHVVVHDARIVGEYREVFGRRKFRGIEVARIDALLARLLAAGDDVGAVARHAGALIDDDDRVFVEVAIAGRADAIVTGNAKHYPLDLGVAVLSPAVLLARLGGEIAQEDGKTGRI